ncbi:MAG: hypothetical protein JNM17_01990 [Archangium sp.]|nr:hypothetical protein [Archangium sp.]
MQLRPLELGELLDKSVSFWRAHWKPLFRLMIGFQLLSFVILSSTQGLTRKLFPLASDLTAAAKTPDLALPHLLGQLGLLTTASLVALYLSQVSGVATTWFSWSRVTGRGEPTPGDAFAHASARLGVITGAFLASIGWSLLVLLVVLIPGMLMSGLTGYFAASDQPGLAILFGVLAIVLLLVGTVGLMLWFIIRFILMSQIIAIESPSALTAFRRADQLSSGRVLPGFMGLVKVRLTVLVTVIGCILLVVGLVNTLPLLALGVAFGAKFTPGSQIHDVVPTAILVPVQLVEAFIGAIVSPLFAVFQTWFYVDMRSRREGLDLELALEGRG